MWAAFCMSTEKQVRRDVEEVTQDPDHIADRIIAEVRAEPIEQRRAERVAILKERYRAAEGG